MAYPVRCEIIDVEGQDVGLGFLGRTPDISVPHIGKHGLAELTEEGHVRITLDDDSVLYGYECWWKPLRDEEDVSVAASDSPE